MELFGVGVGLDKRPISSYLAGKFIDELGQYAVMDIADGQWDNLVDRESNHVDGVVSKYIG
jgi:hypothetical protein